MPYLVSTLVPLFLIGSSSYFQVMRSCVKTWMSSNFGKITPLTVELAAVECLKLNVPTLVLIANDPKLLKLLGDEDKHT